MQTDIKKILDRLDTFLTNDITNFYGLFQGQLGFVLYHIYYYKYTCSEKTKDVIVKKIEDIFDNMSNNNLHSSLATGFTGLYYVLSLLVSENILNKEVLNGNISIKKYIKESITGDIKADHYFLMYGYIGKIITNINDKEFESAILDVIVNLEESSFKEKNGIAWYDPKSEEDKIVNMGLAHGVPSIIMFLTILYAKGIETERIQKLVPKAINFLINSMNINSFSFFPYELPSVDQHSRLAWCYGDLSTSLVLINAGNVFKNTKWIEVGNTIAKKTQTRGLLEAMLNFDKNINRHTCGFCHGTSGIAFLYKKLYLETKDNSFYDSYKWWLQYTVDTLKIELDYLEYNSHKSRTKLEGTNFYVNEKVALIEGVTGAGLVLLDYLSPEHKWEEIFLL